MFTSLESHMYLNFFKIVRSFEETNFCSVFCLQILFDQAQRSIKTQLQTFVKE